MKKIALIIILLVIGGLFVVFSNTGRGVVELITNLSKGDPLVPVKNEIVMPPNSTIKATTKAGTIIIKSGKGLKRYYTWDGITRSVVMWPRSEKWYGSLGLYYPGLGSHWLPKHNGISRGVLEEGQQHFESVTEAMGWLKQCEQWYPTVYSDDGLVVWYAKNTSREQINVGVWQILIQGVKPRKLYGSSNNAISTSWNRVAPR